jgi:hypothetical protein
MTIAMPMPDEFRDEDGRPLALSPVEAEQELIRLIERLACPRCGTQTIREI